LFFGFSRDRRPRKTDDRISPSSKKEQQPQSPKITPTTLSSKIEPVVEEPNATNIQKEDKSNELTSNNSKNEKKHKKHHKKHRHQNSKSKKHRRSKEKEKKTIVDSTTSVIEVQS
jgi:hypothetical protein